MNLDTPRSADPQVRRALESLARTNAALMKRVQVLEGAPTQALVAVASASQGSSSGSSSGSDQVTPVTVAPPSRWPIAVGGIYISIDATIPEIALGYGSWAQFAQGRMLIGLSETDTDFDTPESIAGAKLHSHGVGTLAPSAHAGTAVASHAGHTHTVTATGTAADKMTAGGADVAAIGHTHTAIENSAQSHSVTQPSDHTMSGKTGETVVDDLPPHIVVYMWKRTA